MLIKSTAAPMALLIAACAASSSIAQPTSAASADDTPVHLAPVIVTGRLNPRDAAVIEAADRLSQRAGATTVVSAEDFENGRAATLADIMQFAPGVYAQTRHGEEVRFSIRGSGIQRGFLMRGVQLYQDGVPLNLADGSGDYQSIDPLALQHIEVWRGANALEYGSSTLGGAVNFVTPTGRGADPMTMRADAGAHGQQRGHVMVAGAKDALDGMLSLTHGRQDGWRDHSMTEATRVSGNIGYRFSDTLEGRLYLTHVSSDLQLPGSLSRAVLSINRRQAAQNSAAQNAGNYYTLDRAAARLAWRPSDRLQITASAYVADRDRFHPMVFGILDQNARDTGLDVRGVFDFGSPELTRRLALGAASALYEGTENRFANIGGQRGAPTGQNRLDARLHVFYVEYSHGLSDDLTLQVGAQATRAVRKLDNLMAPTGDYDKAFDGFSPKVGLIWRTSSTDQVFANISRSFEPAPFGEAVVRPLLPIPNAQTATTAEAGWRRNAGAVQLEATIYHSRIDGELLALTDATGASIGTANADRTIHQGVELGASFPLSDRLKVRSVYLWNDFRFDGDARFDDSRIAGIAPHLLHAEVEWRATAWLTIAPMIEWQPQSTWIDHANTTRSDGYMLAHLRVHGDLPHGLRWFADIRNLADRDYVASTAVQANVRGLDGAYYFPGDPRSAYVGLQWRY